MTHQSNVMPGDGELLPETHELVDYIAQYGGRCRDCADEVGICPGSGLPCDNATKAIRHVLKAINYGVANGYLPDPRPTVITDAEVTDEMVDRAMDRAAWKAKATPAEYEGGGLIDPGMSPEEADEINGQLRTEMREILEAALLSAQARAETTSSGAAEVTAADPLRSGSAEGNEAGSVAPEAAPWPWPDKPPFITSTSTPEGDKFVTVKVRDFDALHKAHDIVLAAFTPAPRASPVKVVMSGLEAARDLAKTMEGLTACRSDDDYVWGAQEKIEAAISALVSQPDARIVAEMDALLAVSPLPAGEKDNG